ncbi:TatD family hydrolase [Psychrobacter pygoscelis]|uniref:TatD family hydrolase n=1 Tax=Psychrobacter pygoscelis TaxID=2488563 RepID=UPI00103C7E41|nr:TatD family hydrolase [Psychrobacter pygoscelis]
MTANRIVSPPYEGCYPLIDTHTHFDDPVFLPDRIVQMAQAQSVGVRHLLLIGYVRQYFSRLYDVQAEINSKGTAKVAVADLRNNTQDSCLQYTQYDFQYDPQHDLQSQPQDRLQAHIALGLHPFYIESHDEDDLQYLATTLSQRSDIIAIGEIGLDTYTAQMKQPSVYEKQKRYFISQLDMAVAHGLPVLLHIRKAHADCLKILKNHAYDAHKLGGIAHSFSGGEQEAKAFVKLGFKLGVTGQVTNPNAKKLRRAISAAVDSYGLSCLVIETDCPDMLPLIDQSDEQSRSTNENVLSNESDGANSLNTVAHPQRNTPAHLTYVLATLSELLAVPLDTLAQQLWQNSCEALKVAWHYPLD